MMFNFSVADFVHAGSCPESPLYDEGDLSLQCITDGGCQVNEKCCYHDNMASSCQTAIGKY